MPSGPPPPRRSARASVPGGDACLAITRFGSPHRGDARRPRLGQPPQPRHRGQVVTPRRHAIAIPIVGSGEANRRYTAPGIRRLRDRSGHDERGSPRPRRRPSRSAPPRARRASGGFTGDRRRPRGGPPARRRVRVLRGPARERLVAQIRRPDGRAPREPVLRRGSTHTIGSRLEDQLVEPRFPQAARTDEAEVDLAGVKLLDVEHRRTEAQNQLHVGISRPVGRETIALATPPASDRVGLIRTRPRSPAPVARTTAAARSARLGRSRASPSSALPAGVNHRAAPVAFEQADAELGFERADLLADARLRQVQPVCRAPEVKLLGDHDERAQLPEPP